MKLPPTALGALVSALVLALGHALTGCASCGKPHDYVQPYAQAGEVREKGNGDDDDDEPTWTVEVRAVAESYEDARLRAREAAALAVLPRLVRIKHEVSDWESLLESATEIVEQSATKDRNQIVLINANVHVHATPLQERIDAGTLHDEPTTSTVDEEPATSAAD